MDNLTDWCIDPRATRNVLDRPGELRVGGLPQLDASEPWRLSATTHGDTI